MITASLGNLANTLCGTPKLVDSSRSGLPASQPVIEIGS
jgi:hypothetical protein